jgi:hypothetical protein
MATIQKLVYGKSQDFQADTSNEAWKIMKGPFGYWTYHEKTAGTVTISDLHYLKKLTGLEEKKHKKTSELFFRRCCVFFSAAEDVFQKYFKKRICYLPLCGDVGCFAFARVCVPRQFQLPQGEHARNDLIGDQRSVASTRWMYRGGDVARRSSDRAELLSRSARAMRGETPRGRR